MDAHATLQIEVGDRASAFGDPDNDLFDERELSAESVVQLQSEDRDES